MGAVMESRSYVARLTQGRDRTYTPRLRLPSMEVSKHHASIFAIVRKREPDLPPSFSVTDTASTHGTFVYRPEKESPKPMHPNSVARIPADAFVRLSPAKHASRPFTLQHLDVIRFGVQSNVFEVHMHGTAWGSCPACQLSPDGTNEISLAPLAGERNKPRAVQKNAPPSKSAKQKAEFDTKRHLKVLKEVYLKPLPLSDESKSVSAVGGPAYRDSVSAVGSPAYRDRASLRRERYPGLPDVKREVPRPDMPPPAAPPKALDASNVGYQLLAKMADGAEHIPTQAPITPAVSHQRAGLGSTRMADTAEHSATSAMGYQDQAREKSKDRYKALDH